MSKIILYLDRYCIPYFLLKSLVCGSGWKWYLHISNKHMKENKGRTGHSMLEAGISAAEDEWNIWYYIIDRQYTYIVGKYIINLHSLPNRTEKLANDLLFYLFLKCV